MIRIRSVSLAAAVVGHTWGPPTRRRPRPPLFARLRRQAGGHSSGATGHGRGANTQGFQSRILPLQSPRVCTVTWPSGGVRSVQMSIFSFGTPVGASSGRVAHRQPMSPRVCTDSPASIGRQAGAARPAGAPLECTVGRQGFHRSGVGPTTARVACIDGLIPRVFARIDRVGIGRQAGGRADQA